MDVQMTNQLDFITQRVADRIDFFRGKRSYNRRVTSVFVVAGASLSAIATVSLGASKMTGAQWLELVALIVSGLATVVGALQALLSHRKLWHINNIASAALSKLQFDIQFRQADTQPIDKAEVAKFYERFTTILEEADRDWIETYAVK
jgi:hypothetical protein